MIELRERKRERETGRREEKERIFYFYLFATIVEMSYKPEFFQINNNF